MICCTGYLNTWMSTLASKKAVPRLTNYVIPVIQTLRQELVVLVCRNRNRPSTIDTDVTGDEMLIGVVVEGKGIRIVASSNNVVAERFGDPLGAIITEFCNERCP